MVVLGVYHALDLPKYELTGANKEGVGDVLEATVGECLGRKPEIAVCEWDYVRWSDVPWDLSMSNPMEKGATYLCVLASAMTQCETLRCE